MNRENVRDFNGVGREVRRWRQGEEDGSSNYIFSLTKKKNIVLFNQPWEGVKNT